MKVYVAGPYTRGDPAVNTRNAILVGAELMDAGHTPFIPHLYHLWHLVAPRPYEDWLRLDLEWLTVCDTLLWDLGKCPGESDGACREVERTIELGIPVFYSVAEVLAWAKP